MHCAACLEMQTAPDLGKVESRRCLSQRHDLLAIYLSINYVCLKAQGIKSHSHEQRHNAQCGFLKLLELTQMLQLQWLWQLHLCCQIHFRQH